MGTESNLFAVRSKVTGRKVRKIELPSNENGSQKRVSEYFGENLFHFDLSKFVSKSGNNQQKPSQLNLTKDVAEIVAQAVTEWALAKGATHFCHWFQPLTGSTAEKHDGFIDFDDIRPIEKLGASQLMQGEPDASSFPHGGSRSTFEARGYTSWDISSPMFISDGPNGKTLCIPTAFVSYNGDALDIKTPLLRSISKLSEAGTKFLHLAGQKSVQEVKVTCGAEQEYFLVDRAFYYQRPDLVMTGRTLIGQSTSRNQQLEDHYFGTIPDRVLAFMQEVEFELYKLGVPAKTRHNEVAPGQFEIAQIFREANVSADNNQLVMATIKKVAGHHNFEALLHEKPFAGINGNGKHLNWSLATDTGKNLLEPGNTPHDNNLFLAVTSIIMEAVHRHAELLRVAISGHSNDHRLGANEAPPSIMSIFLGETLEHIFSCIKEGKTLDSSRGSTPLEMGTVQLVNLSKDNTDRNRTSPFAFTGNKFEFRAVGSSAAVGFPLSVLNAAVVDVFQDSVAILEKDLASGKDLDSALLSLTKKWTQSSWPTVFNGDGYSQEWVKEAEKRGLPNLKTTVDALDRFNDPQVTKSLVKTGVFTENEIKTRHNVMLERYITHRVIEFNCLEKLVHQHVLPAAIRYKSDLVKLLDEQKDMGMVFEAEKDILKKINDATNALYKSSNSLADTTVEVSKLGEKEYARKIAYELLPLSEKIAGYCNQIEVLVPGDYWTIPTYFDLLFNR